MRRLCQDAEFFTVLLLVAGLIHQERMTTLADSAAYALRGKASLLLG